MINGMVSVIIPVYNRADKLKEAVMSVLLQSYTIVEIIIVDDGSTDHTSIVASTLAHKWPKTVFVYSQSNAGPGLARELGRTKAQGEFIQYLDSDDILLSEKLSLQTKVLSKNHQCAVVYGIS
ncbi:MAG: glycosyltransferase family 2 protein, partial [Bacteroidota bacterium]